MTFHLAEAECFLPKKSADKGKGIGESGPVVPPSPSAHAAIPMKSGTVVRSGGVTSIPLPVQSSFSSERRVLTLSKKSYELDDGLFHRPSLLLSICRRRK